MDIEKEVKKYVRPVMFHDDCGCHGSFAFIGGTCFFLKILEKKYVVTAKHVVKDHDISDIRIVLDPYSSDKDTFHRPLTLSNAMTLVDTSQRQDQDFPTNDFILFKVDDSEQDENLEPYFFNYVSPPQLNTNGRIFVAGYPNVDQAINEDDNEIQICPDIIFCNNYIKRNIKDHIFNITAIQDELETFNGFSGSPLFYLTPEDRLYIIGVIQKERECTNLLYGEDIRVIECFLSYIPQTHN